MFIYEEFVAYFKTIPQHLSAGDKQNHDKPVRLTCFGAESGNLGLPNMNQV